MDRANVKNLVVAKLAGHLGKLEQGISEESDLFDDLGADSLDFVELTLDFEEMFKIEISDDDLEPLHTVGQVIDLLTEKVSTSMGNTPQQPDQSAATRPEQKPGESVADYQERLNQWQEQQNQADDDLVEDDDDGENEEN